MVNASSTTRLDIWLRIAKIKLNKETLKKGRTPQANIIDVDHLTNEVLKMIFFFFLLSMSTKSIISSGDGFIFV
jgi:hypothetical protein